MEREYLADIYFQFGSMLEPLDSYYLASGIMPGRALSASMCTDAH